MGHHDPSICTTHPSCRPRSNGTSRKTVWASHISWQDSCGSTVTHNSQSLEVSVRSSGALLSGEGDSRWLSNLTPLVPSGLPTHCTGTRGYLGAPTQQNLLAQELVLSGEWPSGPWVTPKVGWTKTARDGLGSLGGRPEYIRGREEPQSPASADTPLVQHEARESRVSHSWCRCACPFNSE